MKKFLVVVLAVAIVVVAATAAMAASIIDSKHDLSSSSAALNKSSSDQLCEFCHTPHGSIYGGALTAPLWNRTGSGASYTLYTSNTITATMSSPAGRISAACLSCHDGTMAINNVWNQPGSGNLGAVTGPGVTAGMLSAGNVANLTADLRNDHPVSFTYNGTAGNLKPVATAEAAGVVFFGGEVECASCHNVHDPGYAPFLRISNTASALCTACHNK